MVDGLFWFIVVLLVTGGYVYRGQHGGRKVLVEAAQLDAWVLAFLLLLVVWWYSGKLLSELHCIRFLEGVWAWIIRKGPRFVYIFTAESALLFTGVSVLRHLSFRTSYDLSIFSQAYWNAVHGDFLFSSIKGGIVLWGDHFNPITLGILPFYWVWPSPEILLILQGLALAAGALPLYGFAREELSDKGVELFIPIAYLLYFPLRRIYLSDFHPIAFSTPLILAAFYSLRKDQYGRFFIFAGLLGLTKESGPIAVGLLGAYCFFAGRKRLLGTGIVLASGLWFFLNINVFIPTFNPEGAQAYIGRYGYMGEGFGEILHTLITRPFFVLTHNLSGKELMYPVRIFGPVAFLPLLTPAGLLALPYFLINLLEDHELQVSLFHYQAEVTAFIFIGTVYGARKFLRWEKRLPAFGGPGDRRRAKALVGVLMAGIFVLFGQSDILQLRKAWPRRQTWNLRAALMQVPPDARVSAQAAIAPHLANRRWLFIFPEVGSANYVVLDSQLDRWPVRAKHVEDEVRKRVIEKGFELVFQRNSARIYRRSANSTSVNVSQEASYD